MDPVRDRLAEAAGALLDKGGPEAVTLREVGRLAGVSHNAPYKHFASKEELLAEVAARELQQRRSRKVRAGDSRAALRRALHAYVRWALEHPHRFKLTFGHWTTGSAALAEAASAARTDLVDTVGRAQADEHLPAGDPERVAALLHALAHGAADLALGGHLARDGKGHADPTDLVDDLLDLMGRAVDRR